ncbi:hypothetical protein WME75_10920 [Sorangium sp. So ce1014]|uniref:hypothetical protein n=1 Tax=Sorangium sp. So ce1014 TaxID=3133326 RepID=UPI003F61C3F5
MSELEFELEMENEDPYASEADEELEGLEGELEGDEEHEGDEGELDSELELDSEADDEVDQELVEPDVRGFGERFYELSLRDMESESDVQQEVDRIIGEMEREYFFGGLGKLVSKAGKSLVKKGLNYAKKKVPIGSVIKGVTALARGNLKGALGSLAGAAMGALSSHPAFAAIMPALQAIGFDPAKAAEGPENREAWSNFARMGKDAYHELAAGLTADSDRPAEAARVAGRAYGVALQRANVRRKHGGRAAPLGGRRPRGEAGGDRPAGRTRVVYLQRGERLIIKAR